MIILSVITSQLQPLDMSVNKPFHHIARKHYDAWLNKENHILAPSGKIKGTAASVIAEHISKAWKETPSHFYSKVVFKCCLFNAENGRQDDALRDDSELRYEGASSLENESATEESLDELSD
jgi:hypothetical protein